MIHRFRGIIFSKTPPEDKNVLWVTRLDSGEIVQYAYVNSSWEVLVGGSLNDAIHIGDTPPDDLEKLWISNVDTSEYKEDNTVIQNLYRRISELEILYNSINKVIKYGAIAGDAETGARIIMMNSAEPINPNGEEDSEDSEDTEDTEGEGIDLIEPLTDGFEPTVPNISIKMDTADKFQENMNNLIDGELCWITDVSKLYIYYQGNFVPIGGSTGGSGVSITEIMAFFFAYVGFKDELENKYRVIVDTNGEVKSYRYEERTSIDKASSYEVWIAPLLTLNSVFCGGDGDSHSFQSCSHNFIELGNGEDKDISLDNLYLLYCDRSDNHFTHKLKLQGVIKAGSTFLIRGAQCSIKTNTTLINVDTYDMEWRDEDGELISFSQSQPVFYLAASLDGTFTNESGAKVVYTELTPNRYVAGTTAIEGYVDFAGFGSGAAAEGDSPISPSGTSKFEDTLFVRYFSLDPTSQANKTYASRKTSALWTYVDLKKVSNEDLVNPLYYYSKSSKLKFAPMSSKEGKNIFTSRSTFSEDKPNMVNITFGIQATDNGNGATRCFNWVSVGYYDEYLEYGTSPDALNTKVYSINEENTYDENITKFIDVYKRKRWITTNNKAVTTHKVIIKNLPAGDYYYRVRRDEDDTYQSDIMVFTVRTDSDVESFDFIQVSDQQGFNWLEYQAWKKSAYHISKAHPNVDFTINTGDITQNGNRESEWLDYYDGRQYLRSKEEMFTIGNNDLCGVEEYLLGNGNANKYKINHNNVTYYYTFELDPDNSQIFTCDGTEFYMPSLYSFNYGKFHFVSINSEFTAYTYQVYTDSESIAGKFKGDVYKSMADWLEADLTKYKNNSGEEDCSKCIVYCHESPFTIITYAVATVESNARGGSKLNDTFTDGDSYMFSRLFKKYGVRLVMCGHKHTYCLTMPVYDAPEGYLEGSAELMDKMSVVASRKPIVQVKSESEIKGDDWARWEVVDKITAPVYVMSQATGYKLVSNKEVPSRQAANVNWLRYYFPGTAKGSSDGANVQQYYPTYIHYEVTQDNIKVNSIQITNIYSTTTASTKAGSFNINAQSSAEMKDQDIVEVNYGTTGGYNIEL